MAAPWSIYTLSAIASNTTRFARRVIRQDAARARRESEEAQLERFKD